MLRDCSVGAIVRGPDSLMVVQDIRTWDRPGNNPREREIRYVDRVKQALGIDRALCAPPRATERDGTVVGWIPALKFPTWTRCLKCNLLHSAPWRRPRRGTSDGEPCSVCGGRLEQAPWVMVHGDGYLADVPWHDLAHADSRNPAQRQCRADWTEPYLKLDETHTGRRILCTRPGCGANTRFPTGTLPRTPFPPFTWQQPWMREPPAQSPEAPAWLMEINDVRVHTPANRTALVIPPESRIRRGTVTDRLYGNTRNQQSIRDARNDLARRGEVRRIASEFRCTPDDITKAMREIDEGHPSTGASITVTDLLVDEYRALTEEIPDLRPDEDFVTEHHTREWLALGRRLADGTGRRVARAVSNVVSVNRLKEVLVFNGFYRAGGERPTPPDITGESDWLPAIELYGEGLFFTLDETSLQRWESSAEVQRRADAFKRRYVRRTGLGGGEFEVDVTPRFLLCHTLAHLVIHQLDADAGYPAASLKERIYCASGTSGSSMAGILIYVAVPDEEGSLGGLMELAKPEAFLRLLTGAFDAATWCSLDPVCAEQEGHGPDLLNRAACHACALVPEPSCAFGNALLDRVFVKGGDDVPAYLDAVSASG